MERSHKGRIEVICGSMFSGKTEELIRRLKRAEIAKLKVAIFKPHIDTRFSANDVVSHNRNSIASTAVTSSESVRELCKEMDVVGIDEAQFFDNALPDVCNHLASLGVRVIVAGLDMDFRRNPFGPIPKLLAIADDVQKVHAICTRCGKLAQYSYRLTSENEQVVLGETNNYEPLCRECYEKASPNMFHAE